MGAVQTDCATRTMDPAPSQRCNGHEQQDADVVNKVIRRASGAACPWSVDIIMPTAMTSTRVRQRFWSIDKTGFC